MAKRRVLHVSRAVSGSERYTIEIAKGCKLSNGEFMHALNGDALIQDNVVRDGDGTLIGKVTETYLETDTEDEFLEG